MMKNSTRIATTLLVTALAQSPFAHAGGPVPAIDPLYLAPATTLEPARIEEMQRRLLDWPQLGRYRAENAALMQAAASNRQVVFFGDSITEGWGATGSDRFFPGKPYVNRGISGQTTAQMLLRFRQDVLALEPAVVVILAGTNDIAGNTGLATQAMIEDNLHSMVELARRTALAWYWHRCCRSAITRGAPARNRRKRFVRSMPPCAVMRSRKAWFFWITTPP